MTFLKPAALVALCLSVAIPALADDYKIGDLVVLHPMAFDTPKTAMSGGGYLTVTNTGATPDRLLAVRAEFPRVMLHTTIETDGIARMRHVEAVEIPAGGTVTLEPGGLHVMFMGLNGDPFEVGEQIPATLVFEIAGEVEVTFDVKERTGHGMSDHSGHGATN